jgi:hypothetical protein
MARKFKSAWKKNVTRWIHAGLRGFSDRTSRLRRHVRTVDSYAFLSLTDHSGRRQRKPSHRDGSAACRSEPRNHSREEKRYTSSASSRSRSQGLPPPELLRRPPDPLEEPPSPVRRPESLAERPCLSLDRDRSRGGGGERDDPPLDPESLRGELLEASSAHRCAVRRPFLRPRSLFSEKRLSLL